MRPADARCAASFGAGAAVAVVCLIVVLLAACLWQPSTALAAQQAAPETSKALSAAVDSLRSYAGVSAGQSALEKQDKLPAGEGVADWIAFDLARLDADSQQGYDAYLRALGDYVTAGYATDELLDRYESTPWMRTAIVAKTLGGDPTSVGKAPDGKPVDLVADGIFNWTHTADLGLQGSNALMHALYALDATQAEQPAGALYTREYLVQKILTMQTPDGAFSLIANSTEGSVDLTGMALAALSTSRDLPGVEDAIERAVDYLSGAQSGDGGFSSENVANSESCSMVILGLCAVQIDPANDARFVKNGHSVVDALLAFQRGDGSFSHADEKTQSIELMATEQAIRALSALAELQGGADGNVYTLDCDLSFALAEAPAAQQGVAVVPLILGIVLGIALIIGLSVLVKRKRASLFS